VLRTASLGAVKRVARVALFAATFGGPSLAGAGCDTNELVDVGANFDATAPQEAAALDAEGVEDAPGEAEAETSVRAEASTPDAASEAEAAPILSELCIPNPSFETMPPAATATPVLSAPPQWTQCTGSNMPGTSACNLPPIGDTCLGLSVGPIPLASSVDVEPCNTVVPGASYAVTLDFAIDAPNGDGGPGSEPPALQLWGNTAECTTVGGDLLARYSLSYTCGWKTLCGGFMAKGAYTHFLLIPETSSSTLFAFGGTQLLVDDLQTDLACPPP
jgi:hypothetical protein